jgi:hypothetical protein
MINMTIIIFFCEYFLENMIYNVGPVPKTKLPLVLCCVVGQLFFMISYLIYMVANS